jgi:hypothetical protein
MIIVPELRGDKHVLPSNVPRPKHPLHRVADRLFIAIAFSTIEVAKSHFQRRRDRLFGREGIGMSVPKPRAGIAPDPW